MQPRRSHRERSAARGLFRQRGRVAHPLGEWSGLGGCGSLDVASRGTVGGAGADRERALPRWDEVRHGVPAQAERRALRGQGQHALIAAIVASTAASFVVLAAIFVPLERLLPARPQPIFRRGLALDAAFFLGQYVVWSTLAIACLGAAREGMRHALGAYEALTHVPLWLRVVLAVVGGDFLVYWFHRASHALPFLWRFHAVHHTSEHLDWIAAHREHPVDGVLTQLAANAPAFVLGLPLEALAGVASFRGLWAVFVHSNVRVPLGPLRWLLGAPDLHHWHHARVPITRHNFANLAPWLDWVFGTHHRPEPHASYSLGVSEPSAQSYLGHMVAPFVGHRKTGSRDEASWVMHRSSRPR